MGGREWHEVHFQVIAQYDKLRADTDLIPNMVDEIIRWQTPLIHMRRTVSRDVEYGGAKLKKGDKVVLWYLSANRDESMFEDGHMLKVLYTLLVDFRRAPGPGKVEPAVPAVHPDDIRVKIKGTVKRKALILHQLGTIPEEEEVELPEFEPER